MQQTSEKQASEAIRRRTRWTRTVSIGPEGAIDFDFAQHDDRLGANWDSTAGGVMEEVERLVNADRVEPRYRIEETLGSGGNGIVYLAKDLPFGREVAIKVSKLADAAVVEACLREARIIASLEHPGIVPIYEMHHAADGRAWYAMRRLAGRSLDNLITDQIFAREMAESRRSERRRTIGINERVTIMLRTLEAVGFAHSRSVVHQDLKPANIMLDQHGDVLVVDWGSALTPDRHNLVLHGTPGYMSPEQARGEDTDHRSDIYALGSTLFELLFWRLPADTLNDDEFWRMKRSGEILPPSQEELSSIPTPLVAIARKALAPDPGDRYQTVEQMYTDLERFQAGLSVTAHLENPFQALWRWSMQHKVAVGVVLGNAVLAVVLGMTWWQAEVRAEQKADLIADIDHVLVRESPMAGWLADLEGGLGRLADLDPQAADQLQGRVVNQVHDRAANLLARPTVDTAVIDAVEQAADWLDANPDLQESLYERLEERRSQWSRVMRLQAPITLLPSDWREGWRVTRPGQLQAVGRLAQDDAVPTPIQVEGGVLVTLRWTPFALAPGEKIGVTLDGFTGGDYQAILQLDASDTGTAWVEFSQSGQPLHRRPIPAPATIEDLAFSRVGSRLALTCNQIIKVAYDDVLPLAEGRSQVAIIGAARHPLEEVLVARRRPPQRLIQLEIGDRHFRRGEWQQAADAYAAQQHAADNEIAGEAQYKYGRCLFKLNRKEEASEVWSDLLQDGSQRWSLIAGCELWAWYLISNQVQKAHEVVEALAITGRSDALGTLPHELRSRLLIQVRGTATGANLMRPDPTRSHNLRMSLRALQALDADVSSTAFTVLALARSLHWEGRHADALAVVIDALAQRGIIREDRSWYLLSREALWLGRLIREEAETGVEPLAEGQLYLHPDARAEASVQDLLVAGEIAQAHASADSLIERGKLAAQGYVPWVTVGMARAVREDGTLDPERLASVTAEAYRREPLAADSLQGSLGELLALATASASGQADQQMVNDFARSALAGAGAQGSKGLAQAAIGILKPSPEFFHRAWGSPRGLAVLRDWSERKRSIRALVTDVFALFVFTRMSRELLPKESTEDLEEDLWVRSRSLIETYLGGELPLRDLIAFGLMYLDNPLAPNVDDFQQRLPAHRWQDLGRLLVLKRLVDGERDAAQSAYRDLRRGDTDRDSGSPVDALIRAALRSSD